MSNKLVLEVTAGVCVRLTIGLEYLFMHLRSPRSRKLSWAHDEAHFWLNGYVNKQNCRIWSESNPQVYVETPLHPEKLTVWCALWAGGILLQKR
ncbi:putative transposable element [Trichonephila clavipes]|nr:putative transposable element [Trichonephila clavipes]